jgi:hypothetical protein
MPWHNIGNILNGFSQDNEFETTGLDFYPGPFFIQPFTKLQNNFNFSTEFPVMIVL